jgi:mutator protein MutT
MKPGKSYIGLGVGAIIINNRDEILLMKRSKNTKLHKTTANLWSTPGGVVEFGEKIEDAIIREVKEELGVEIDIKKIIGNWDQILPKAKVHWHCVSFLATIKNGIPKILETDKFDELKWFPINNPPEKSGIAHVIIPLYFLGKISPMQLKHRIKITPES